MVWAYHRKTDYWNPVEKPEKNPPKYEHLLFGKESRNVQWKKKSSSTNGALIIDCWHVEKCKSSTLHKTQVQVVQRLQCTMRYTDSDRRNTGDKL